MKKDLDYYMHIPYNIKVYNDTVGTILFLPALPGCIACSHSYVKCFEKLKENKKQWILNAFKDGNIIPENLI